MRRIDDHTPAHMSHGARMSVSSKCCCGCTYMFRTILRSIVGRLLSCVPCVWGMASVLPFCGNPSKIQCLSIPAPCINILGRETMLSHILVCLRPRVPLGRPWASSSGGGRHCHACQCATQLLSGKVRCEDALAKAMPSQNEGYQERPLFSVHVEGRSSQTFVQHGCGLQKRSCTICDPIDRRGF